MKTIEDAVRELGGVWPGNFSGDHPLFDVLVWAGSLGWKAWTKEWAGKEFHDWYEVCTRTEFEACARRLRNEPDWKDAPDWAVAKAQDSDGKWWWWYSTQPKAYEYSWEDDKEEGEAQLAGKGEVIGDWKQTLRLRPEEKKMEDKNDWHAKGEFPPVGTVCLGRVLDTSIKWVWTEVEVLKLKEDEAAVHVISLGMLRWCDEFKPLQTEREQLIEEARKVARMSQSIKQTVVCLLDAGMLKMPEDK